MGVRSDRQAERRRLRPASEGPGFFVGGLTPGAKDEGPAYERLREAVQATTERVPRDRRIFRLGCRIGGRDCQVEVGQPYPDGEMAVVAIFDVGGDEPYSICTADDTAGPTLRLGKRRVYSVIEFA